MLRTHRPIAAAVSLTLAAFLILPSPALAQAGANTPAPQGRSAAKRTAWILIGAGIGFGAGLLFGVARFDDAVYAERKIWTSALVGSATGGVAAGALSWNAKPTRKRKGDDLWQGMLAGAALGALIDKLR